MKHSETALVIADQMTPAFGHLFSDINFASLNSSIEDLALSSKELAPDEKEAARGTIDKWENLVIERLEEHDSEMHEVIDFFDPTRVGKTSSLVSEEMEEDIAEKTDTRDLYKKYQKARDQYHNHLKEKPIDIDPDADLSHEEYLLAQKDMAKEKYSHELKCKRLERQMILDERAWKLALSRHEAVRVIVGKSRRYNRGLKHYIADCKAKSQSAKLSVSISSEQARKALKDLLAFSVEL